MNRQYTESLGLVSFDIDKDIFLEKKSLDLELKNSIKNYDNYINNKLILDGNNSPTKKIPDVIYDRFFWIYFPAVQPPSEIIEVPVILEDFSVVKK